MIIYTCPECGHDLMIEALTSVPPINKYYCFNCGWSHTIRDEITRIPFGGNSLLMEDDTCKEVAEIMSKFK